VKTKTFDADRCAKAIRKARLAKGWSMRVAAKQTNDVIPEHYWSKWENAHATPSVPFLFMVAQLLETPADVLMGLRKETR
jgi:transcriptional regulator with XRE-family HTH domain